MKNKSLPFLKFLLSKFNEKNQYLTKYPVKDLFDAEQSCIRKVKAPDTSRATGMKKINLDAAED